MYNFIETKEYFFIKKKKKKKYERNNYFAILFFFLSYFLSSFFRIKILASILDLYPSYFGETIPALIIHFSCGVYFLLLYNLFFYDMIDLYLFVREFDYHLFRVCFLQLIFFCS